MIAAIAEYRSVIVGTIFIALILGLIAAYVYGRKVIRSEKTDAVLAILNARSAVGIGFLQGLPVFYLSLIHI